MKLAANCRRLPTTSIYLSLCLRVVGTLSSALDDAQLGTTGTAQLGPAGHDARMSLSDRNLRAPLEQAAEVRREGFTVQPRALAARQVARCRAACPAAHDCCLAGFGVQHSPGHYDVLVPGFAGPRFGFLHAGAPWMGTARALLGDGCALLAAGVLDSDPGAAAGEARHGSAHLLEEPLAGAAASPPHCIAVLIPLVDLGGETNGTAVWPRSHHGGGWSPPEGDGTGDCLLVGRDSASPAALPPPLATGCIAGGSVACRTGCL